MALFLKLSLVFLLLLSSNQGFCAAPQASHGVIKATPSLTMKSLADRPDQDRVEFANGRSIRVGDLRRLQESVRKANARPVSQRSLALKMKPAAKGVPIRTAADLASALKGPDTATVELPNGKLATGAQIKFVQPYLEKRLGRSLTALPQRPNLRGQVVRVSKSTTAAQWEAIRKMPASTILESSPGRNRITVGELNDAVVRGLIVLPGTSPPKQKSTKPISRQLPASSPVRR